MFGYYVDENGKIQDTQNPPYGCRYEFRKMETYTAVWVVNENNEVISETVLWPTLEELTSAIEAN